MTHGPSKATSWDSSDALLQHKVDRTLKRTRNSRPLKSEGFSEPLLILLERYFEDTIINNTIYKTI